MTKSVCVFCGSAPGARPSYSAAARELGAALAQAGHHAGVRRRPPGAHGHRRRRGAAGRRPRHRRDPAHAHRTRAGASRTSRASTWSTTMHERKTLMAEMSDAFVGLPGGMGTFDELVEIVTWAQLGLARQTRGAGQHRQLLRAAVRHARQRGGGGLRHAREPGALAQRRIRDVRNANPYERRACRRGNSLTCRAAALESPPSPGRGNSSVGRARPCQGRGREFESRFPLQFFESSSVRTVARWQNGYAAACKAVYAGSIPTLASIIMSNAPVAELVDARDLKSLGRKAMPVRFRPGAPSISHAC